MRTLRLGCKGEDVRELQTALNCGLEADGIFGKLTRDAVKSYQAAHGLEVDGIAGPQTQAALRLIVHGNVTIACEDIKQFASPHGPLIYGPDKSYSTYSSGGCGVTAFAIVLRALGLAKNDTPTMTVQKLGRYAWENGYRIKGHGTSAGLFGTNGCKRTSITAKNIESEIRAGNLCILCIKNGFPNGYTGSGHYIVAYGIKDGFVLLRDVGSSKSSRQKAQLSKIGTGLKAAYSITKKD